MDNAKVPDQGLQLGCVMLGQLGLRGHKTGMGHGANCFVELWVWFVNGVPSCRFHVPGSLHPTRLSASRPRKVHFETEARGTGHCVWGGALLAASSSREISNNNRHSPGTASARASVSNAQS